MKNKKIIILIAILGSILLLGVVLFFCLPNNKKSNKEKIKYGIKNTYTINNNYNSISKNIYTTFNYDSNEAEVYDYNNKYLFSFDTSSNFIEYDDKYTYIYNVTDGKITMYDSKGKELYKNKDISVIPLKDKKYFIIDNKLYNFDLEFLYDFNKTITHKDNFRINNNLLFSTNSNNNICIELNNYNTVIEGYEDVISADKYTLFLKNKKYYVYEDNKKIKEYDKVDYLSFYNDPAYFNDNSLLLKLTSGSKVEYIIDNEIVSKPELKIGNVVVDLGACTIGGKIKIDGKLLNDNCYFDVMTFGNQIIATDINDDEIKLFVNGVDKTEKDTQYTIIGNYLGKSNYKTNEEKIYDKNGKELGDFFLKKYNDIYIKIDDGEYFVNEDLESISSKYHGIYCNFVTDYCSVENDNGNHALFYKNNQLTDFIYYNVELFDNIIILEDGIFTQALILDKDTDNQKVLKNDYSEIDNIDIKKIKEENNLSFDIPEKYEKLFKKYAYVVEHNDNITKYKSYVYDLFQILMKENITPYINEPFFLRRLGKLSIVVNPNIVSGGASGYYYDGSTNIELDEEYSPSTYHELTHFIDFTINHDVYESTWYCNNKLYDNNEYKKLSSIDKKTCTSVNVYDLNSEVLTEAGAELYTAKYFKKGVSSYTDITAYVTAIEYIVGSKKMDEIFLAKNSNYTFMKLFIDNGMSLDEYTELIKDLSKYTYPSRNNNYEHTGKSIDALIDLYKAYKKDKNWEDDEVFKYILRSFLDVSLGDKYSNSKYKKELKNVAFKSFDSLFKYEKELLKELPDNIRFSITPVPPYIIDDEVYMGTLVIIDEKYDKKTYGYIKYDFDNKKIIESKYPITIK